MAENYDFSEIESYSDFAGEICGDEEYNAALRAAFPEYAKRHDEEVAARRAESEAFWSQIKPRDTEEITLAGQREDGTIETHEGGRYRVMYSFYISAQDAKDMEDGWDQFTSAGWYSVLRRLGERPKPPYAPPAKPTPTPGHDPRKFDRSMFKSEKQIHDEKLQRAKNRFVVGELVRRPGKNGYVVEALEKDEYRIASEFNPFDIDRVSKFDIDKCTQVLPPERMRVHGEYQKDQIIQLFGQKYRIEADSYTLTERDVVAAEDANDEFLESGPQTTATLVNV